MREDIGMAPLCDNLAWIPHEGGECPLLAHQLVEIMHRAGSTTVLVAGAAEWSHGRYIFEIFDTASESDIVAFRLINVMKLNAMLGRAAEMQRRVDAYRLQAVNEGWSWRMVDAYGRAEYLHHRITNIDAAADRTIASGYDAAAFLRDGLAKVGK